MAQYRMEWVKKMLYVAIVGSFLIYNILEARLWCVCMCLCVYVCVCVCVLC